jgi:hypothetical protein
MIYVYKQSRRRVLSPFAVVAFVATMLYLLFVLPSTRSILENAALSMFTKTIAATKNLIPDSDKEKVAIVTKSTTNKDTSRKTIELEADSEGNLIFNKEIRDKETILVKLKPTKEGVYLFSGQSCMVKRITDDGLLDIGEDGDSVDLKDLDVLDYYVACDKRGVSDIFSFSLQFNQTGLATGKFGTGGPAVTGTIGAQTAQRTGSSAQTSGSTGTQPINNNFSPTNNFSPQNNTYTNPPSNGGSAQPTPTPQPSGNGGGGGGGGLPIPTLPPLPPLP